MLKCHVLDVFPVIAHSLTNPGSLSCDRSPEPILHESLKSELPSCMVMLSISLEEYLLRFTVTDDFFLDQVLLGLLRVNFQVRCGNRVS